MKTRELTALATCITLLFVAPGSSWAAGNDDDDLDAAALSNFRNGMQTVIRNQAHNQAVIDGFRATAEQERTEQAARIAAFRAQQREAALGDHSAGGMNHLHDCNNPGPGAGRIC